jgi:xanthine dehydrogenase YagR molybdenum-binding subunit
MTHLDTSSTDTRLVGKPVNRLDGVKKVTGTATYAHEHAQIGQVLIGVFATATIGHGELLDIRTSVAEAMPGVHRVITHKNCIPHGKLDPSEPNFTTRVRPILSGARIHHYGQPIALVVADTFEQARDAAHTVEAIYRQDVGIFSYLDGNEVVDEQMAAAGFVGATDVGDFEGGFASSAVSIDSTFETPMQLSQPMEPHSTLAWWVGETLNLVTSHQTISNIKTSVQASLGLPSEHLLISAPFVGGGFGSKLAVHADLMGAAIAAKMLNRPVKLSMSRRQMFGLTGVRPWQKQRVRLGAEVNGRLIAIGHEALVYSNRNDPFVEQTATVTRSLYAAPNRMTRHRSTHLDLPNGEAVRAPGEMTGLLAVEVAMDELAEKLAIDPVELRVMNDTAVDPETGVPLTGRRLSDCLQTGAARFGWSQRHSEPGKRRDGQWLIGAGMASAIRFHFQGPAEVEVAVRPNGRIEVRSDITDIGTGSYTILAQIAAELLGQEVHDVDVMLAHSSLPPGGGSGGSWGASNTGAALHRACLSLLEQAGAQPGSDLVKQVLNAHPTGLSAIGSIASSAETANWEAKSRHTYGAHFIEVGVHQLTGELQIRRMLGVFSAGRILNPKTARSQLLGGMIWGVSAAVRESAEVDTRYGNIVNGDLAEYLMPVHADIPDVEVIMLDQPDLEANPIGVKGVGELGNCGSSAALANAIYNACGVRTRSFPINLSKLLSAVQSL